MVPLVPVQPNLTKMKRSALLNLILFTVVLSIGAVGCSRGPKSLTPIPGQAGYDSTDGGGLNDATPFGDTDISETGIPQFDGRPTLVNSIPDAEFFSANTVYFEFDSSAVNPSDIANIETVADYMSSNLNEAVLIEGHCDDRGTEEYNRSLGERRALSVREILVTQLSISPERVLTVSYGEDIPAVDGRDEAAYSKNRRGEFVLLRPKN